MSSVNGCFNPNSVCLGSAFFLLDHRGKYFFNGLRVCPRLMVVFYPNSVCLGSCIFFVGSQG